MQISSYSETTEHGSVQKGADKYTLCFQVLSCLQWVLHLSTLCLTPYRTSQAQSRCDAWCIKLGRPLFSGLSSQMGQQLGQLTGDFCRFASSGGGRGRSLDIWRGSRTDEEEAGDGQCSDLHMCIFFACRYSG